MTALPTISVDDSPLTWTDLELAVGPVRADLGPDARRRVRDGRAFVERCLADRTPVYGSTTGFGPLVRFDGRSTAVDQCDNVLQHLTAGQGPDLPAAVVRATALVRLWSLAQGRSGVSEPVLDALSRMLATTFCPAVPSIGSVGASGDLVPLAHMVQVLRGVGEATVDGRRMPAAQALAAAGLEPVRLDGRDALGLVNGTSVTTAAAALTVGSARRSLRAATALTALLADLLGSTPAFLAPPLLRAFNHPAVIRTGAALARLLDGVRPGGDRPLQEPYSIRCTPQLLGAAVEGLDHVAEVVGRDLGGVSDNPLFFAEDDLIAHGGNFFGQPAAFAADHLSGLLTQTGNLGERQLDLLIDPHRNGGRPPMLASVPGEQHGLQGVQVVATSLVVTMRRAATPAGMQSLPTNGHNQDVVPFGTQAALTALEQAGALRLLHGCLAVALRQAAHVGARKPTATHCAELLDRLAEVVEPIDRDRPLHADVRAAAAALDAYVDERAAVWTAS